MIQSLNFRLGDAMPQEVLDRWKNELGLVNPAGSAGVSPASDPTSRRDATAPGRTDRRDAGAPSVKQRQIELRRRVEEYLDAGHGAADAPTDEVPRLVMKSLKRATAHALVLTGVRRCGKSTLQQQLRRRERGPAVFCNLEDTRLYGLGPADFPTLLSVLEEHHPGAAVYLDEAQEAIWRFPVG